MSTERPLIGCDWHDGADIDACGCPALDSPGAIAYRGLLVKARAEIARLTAEMARVTECYSESHAAVGQLTRDIDAGREIDRQNVAEINRLTAELDAARAVPADVDAAIDAIECRGCGHGDPVTNADADRLKAAIARAISDATAAAVGEFIDRHAKRLCEQAGHAWNRDDEEAEEWASDVHDVLNHLRADETGRVHDGRKRSAAAPATAVPRCSDAGIGTGVCVSCSTMHVVPAAPATVGGLLETAPVVEYQVDLGRAPRWRQTRHGRTRTWLGSSPVGMSWTEWSTGSDDVDEYAARLVPAAEADLDPATRGPLPNLAAAYHPHRDAES